MHPNLARIAASYQQILGRISRGEIDLVRAHGEIRELVARDDQGVQWTINPRDGGWMFLSRNGQWMPADPPREGFATMTPHDLREMNQQMPVAYNPDWDITMEKATAQHGATHATALVPGSKKRVRILVAAMAAIGLAILVWAVASHKTEMIAPGPIVPAPTVLGSE